MQPNSFKSARRLALTSIVCLIVVISCDFLEIIYNLIFMAYFPNLGDSDTFTTGEMIMGFAALALLAVKFAAYIATIVFFLMWLYRAYKNLEAINIRGLETSAGWAVGYWFIPILNLFKPLKVVNEVYHGSDPQAVEDGFAFSDTSTPALHGFWWACWLLSNFVSRIASAMEKAAKDVTENSILVYVVSLALSIVAGLLLIFIIREIDRRQTEVEQKLTFAVPPAPPVFNQPVPPPNQIF